MTQVENGLVAIEKLALQPDYALMGIVATQIRQVVHVTAHVQAYPQLFPSAQSVLQFMGGLESLSTLIAVGAPPATIIAQAQSLRPKS